MPHWMIKAAIQAGLAQLPQPQRYNRLLQRYVTRRLRMSEARVIGKFAQCRRHMANWRADADARERAPRILELGTGWYPVVPIGLSLLGAGPVTSVDVDPLMGAAAPLQTAACYLRLLDAGRLPEVDGARVEALREALGASASGAELLARLGIEVRVADARALPLDPGTIDLFVSNNTLEHVPAPAILALFGEFARVAGPRARMSHFIDMADHYALFDPSITVFNYLRYSEAQWRLFNNSLHYQNRLRLSDYRRLHEASGWRVVSEDATEGSADALGRVPVDASFGRYGDRDLRVFESWIVSTKPE